MINKRGEKMNLKKLLLGLTDGAVSLDELPQFWDEYAQFYERLQVVPSYRDLSALLLDALFPCPGGLVHDGGCGVGYYFADILDRTQAVKLIGTDFSPEMLKRARHSANKLSQECGAALMVEVKHIDLVQDWPRGPFDAQIFQLVANFLPGTNWKRIIDQSYRTTKPDGYLYTTTMLAGLSVQELAKKHILHEALGSPLASYPAMLKARNTMKRFNKLASNGHITQPCKQEYIAYHRQVGFQEVEVIGEAFWGAGIVVRARR